MPGSPKKRARREAAERAKQITAAAPEGSVNAPAERLPTGAVPAGAIIPVVQGEIVEPAPEITRTALKRAMRARAQEHAEAAIAVLVKNMKNGNPDVRERAANRLLEWGFGKPGLELTDAEGGLLVTIQKFGALE